MKNNKHTSGDWIAVESFNLWKIKNDRLDIVSQTEEKLHFVAADVSPCDARLIASAPEMLHALELVFSNAGESPEWIRARVAPVISKAKGQE